ncbi:MAG: protease-associated domain-containing protein [Burkholderiales bacterium]
MAPKLLPIMGLLLLLGGCAEGRFQPHTTAPAGTSPVPAPGEILTSPPPVRQVSLVVMHSEATLQLLIKGKKLMLHSPEDFILQSRRLEKTLTLDRADWVFVGYGVTVPALGWDSYQNQDMHGKTVVMLSGAPALPDGLQVSSQAVLKHPVVSNLGHWRSKFDNAQRHGAAMAIILHDPKAEGVGYETLSEFQEMVMAAPAVGTETMTAFGWMPETRLAGWLKRGGIRWDTLKSKAGLARFSPIELPIASHLQMTNRWRDVEVAVPQ